MLFEALQLSAGGALMGLGGYFYNRCAFGRKSKVRSAAANVFFWALPLGAITLADGATVTNAAEFAAAGWIGILVPQSRLPDCTMHASVVVQDVLLLLLRAFGVMIPLSCMFILCGAMWWLPILAAAFSPACVSIGNLFTIGRRGARRGKQMFNILWPTIVGICVGFAILVPTSSRDLLP